MKNLIAALLLLTFPAFGASTSTVTAVNTEGFFSGQNLVKDAGFEGQNKGGAWTVSAGTLTTTSTTPGRGSYSGSWAATGGAGRTLKSKLIAIPAGMYGKNGVATCMFKAGSGTATHTFTASDGTNPLVTAVPVVSSTTTWPRTTVNFIFPSSGSIQLLGTSVSTTEPTLLTDDCYLGLADGYNLSQVSQAQFIGSAYIAATASCQWSRTSTVEGSFSAVSACPGPTIEYNYGPGTIQTTDTDLPQVTVNNLPPGNYQIISQTNIAGSAANYHSLTLSDGTTVSGSAQNYAAGVNDSVTVVGNFSYSQAGNRTFALWGSAATGSVIMDNGAGNFRVTFSIHRFPSTSDLAYRANSIPLSWSGGSTATYNFANSGLAVGDATSITGTNVFTNIGTPQGGMSCSATTSQAGVTCANLTPGTYQVCANGTAQSFGGTGNVAWTLNDGSNNLIADAGYTNVAATGGAFITSACGLYTVASLSSPQFKIRSGYNGAASAAKFISGNLYSITFTITNMSAGIPAPITVNSVTSNSAGSERVERATIANPSGTASITTQSGSWLSSASRTATGQVTVNFTAGMFSSAPTCLCSAATSAGESCDIVTAATTSSVGLYTRDGVNANRDTGIALMCMGPR